MQDRIACLRLQQNVFGAALNGIDALSGKNLGDFTWNGPAQIRAAKRHADDSPTDKVRCDASSGGFDFG